MSRRRESEAEGEWVGVARFRRSGDFFGDAVLVVIWDEDEEERERVIGGDSRAD